MGKNALAWLLLLCACDAERPLTSGDIATLRASLLSPDAIRPSPTNAVADDARAAALGRLLFFDKRMSADGTVSCASCHDPASGFSDPRPLSLGVEMRPGGRHSMPITAVAFQRALFWDGRADSLWAQPLRAIESSKEMDFSRAEVAHFIATSHAADYTAIFGALPDLTGVPARAEPGMTEWDALTEAQRDGVQRVFANTGKVLEAYERKILCADTRFDQWARDEVALTSEESSAAARFVHEGCPACHAGPAYSDGKFHNIGLGSTTSEPDRGSFDQQPTVEADVFNGAGPYSDDRAAGQAAIAALALVPRPLGAFRTASLRGVTQRRAFGHVGHELALDDFIDDVYTEPHTHPGAVGEVDPFARGIGVRADAVMPFLEMLACPPLPEWGAPL